MTHAADNPPDMSLLAGLQETNPAFIDAALLTGGFVQCGSCARVLAVAVNKELAEATALANHTARRIGRELRCPEHDHIEKAKSGAHR